MEGFDPAINYGPNDAGISAITIILGIIGLIAISWLFGKIYEQVAKFFETDKKRWIIDKSILKTFISIKQIYLKVNFLQIT